MYDFLFSDPGHQEEFEPKSFFLIAEHDELVGPSCQYISSSVLEHADLRRVPVDESKCIVSGAQTRVNTRRFACEVPIVQGLQASTIGTPGGQNRANLC